jgi:hypothetical protein
MERVRIEREAFVTEVSKKPTGRQVFEMNKNKFEDLTLTEDEVDDSGQLEDGNSDQDDDENDDTEFVYDRALYGQGGDDEDVDFD